MQLIVNNSRFFQTAPGCCVLKRVVGQRINFFKPLNMTDWTDTIQSCLSIYDFSLFAAIEKALWKINVSSQNTVLCV